MKKLLKWTGIVLGSLVGLLVIALVVLYILGGSKVNATYEVTPALSSVPSDSATIARGSHLASIHACRYCHGDNLEGKIMADIPPFLLAPTNLTPGKGWTFHTASANCGHSQLAMPIEMCGNRSTFFRVRL